MTTTSQTTDIPDLASIRRELDKITRLLYRYQKYINNSDYDSAFIDGQFEPGQSGNPAGRPRGRKNQSTLLRSNLNSARMAMILDHYAARAEKGDMRATTLLFKLCDVSLAEEEAL